jgi:hypothetical protein
MNKRALLQAELEFHERKIARCKVALAHFDATLACYEETKDAKIVRRRYLSNRASRIFEHGQVSNEVADTLREAPKPQAMHDIFAGVAGALGITLPANNSRVLYRNVRSAVANKVAQGVFFKQRGDDGVVVYGLIRK